MKNLNFRGLLKGVFALLLVTPLTTQIQAETIAITAKITRTMTSSSDEFGGCAVELSVLPTSEGLNCEMDGWVTFSCVGEHTTESNALRMTDTAQMAFAMGRRVVVWVDDSRKHDNRCFVSRIDMLDEEDEE